jgi:HTH-type transcriptional regulator / antitoxin HipB
MDLQEIGQIIRSTRKSQSLSQQALGASLGMSRASISGIETGKVSEIGIRKMMALCAALGLELRVVAAGARPTLRELRAERDEATGH